MAMTHAAQELRWFTQLYGEVRPDGSESSVLPVLVRLLTDNQSALHMSKNDLHHSRCKHIDLRYHFMRELVAAGALQLDWCSSVDNQADMLTKALGPTDYHRQRSRITGAC